MGSRDARKGTEAASALGGRFVQLDVTDDESVRAAAETIGRLDVLINNAGIIGSMAPIRDLTADDLREVFETNTFGQLRVTQHFLPFLEKSERPVMVYVSSGLGSHGRVLDPSVVEFHVPTLAYGAAKAALNMITIHHAKTFPSMRINCVDPGYTATDLNHHQGPQTIEEGAEIIVRMAQITPDGPTGTFVDRHGTVPW
jgi:NAD(P)-dependent dehydrogenase (short-subunit alcohol dehydrogenase family)